MNIVIIGLHSAHNEGDRYLLDRSLTLLQEVFPHAHITLVANDPESFHSFGNVIPSLTWCLKRSSPSRPSTWVWEALVRAPVWMSRMILGLRQKQIPVHLPPPLKNLVRIFLHANLVIAAPGNYLYSSGRTGIVFFLTAFHLWMATIAEKPLYLLPQSIGPLRHARERVFLQYILSKARLIFLRDELSARLVASLGKRSKSFRAVVVPDLAFTLDVLSTDQGRELLSPFRFSELKGPKLGVTVLDWQRLNPAFQGQERYERAVASALDFFISQYRGYAFLFPQVRGPSLAENDLIPAKRVYTYANQQDRIFIVEHVGSKEQLLSAYGLMDMLLGTRLHSVIFAFTQGVPVLAIAYQPKTIGVLRTVGLEQWVINIEEVTGTRLIQLLTQLWNQRDSVSAHIAHLHQHIRTQMAWIGETIRRDYENVAAK